MTRKYGSELRLYVVVPAGFEPAGTLVPKQGLTSTYALVAALLPGSITTL